MTLQYDGRRLKKFSSTGKLADLEPPPLLSEIFHENTKLTPLSARAYSADIAKLLRSPEIEVIRSPAKIYSFGNVVALPAVDPCSAPERAIAERRSGRRYSGAAMELFELSRLLFYAYGLTDSGGGRRSIASAGCFYPLELYLMPLRVRGLEAGIYHFDVERHRLDLVQAKNPMPELENVISFSDVDLAGAALVLVVTAIFRRTSSLYRERGYRFVLIEAGEVAQQICLLAAAIGFASCLLGGFYDDRLGSLLDCDSSEESPVLPMIIGGRSPEAQHR